MKKRPRRIRFSDPHAGFPTDAIRVASLGLVVGKVYIVAESDESRVWLREHPTVSLSAELFTAVKGRSIDPRVLHRRRQARYRLKWRKLGLSTPAKRRWLRQRPKLRAESRRLGLCPECGEAAKPFVYCFTHRVSRAALMKRQRAKQKVNREVAA